MYNGTPQQKTNMSNANALVTIAAVSACDGASFCGRREGGSSNCGKASGSLTINAPLAAAW